MHENDLFDGRATAAPPAKVGLVRAPKRTMLLHDCSVEEMKTRQSSGVRFGLYSGERKEARTEGYDLGGSTKQMLLLRSNNAVRFALFLGVSRDIDEMGYRISSKPCPHAVWTRSECL
nr:hypothetical protein CFP56_78469 [Quercus suber]